LCLARQLEIRGDLARGPARRRRRLAVEHAVLARSGERILFRRGTTRLRVPRTGTSPRPAWQPGQHIEQAKDQTALRLIRKIRRTTSL
jgi:hypothetical protein